MTTCARCGHELGIGRFCLNCGHPVGEPVPAADRATNASAPERTDSPADNSPTVHPQPPASARQQIAHSTDAGTDAGTDVGARADTRSRSPETADSGRPRWLGAAPTWWPYAALAAVLLVLLVVLVSCLGSDDDEEERAAPASDDRSAKASDMTRDLEVEAPAAAAPSTDLDGTQVSFEAENMLDGAPSTAWRTAGDATGTTITFTLPEQVLVKRVGLVNGWARKVENVGRLVDWYALNRRITRVEWSFDDGTKLTQELDEKPALQRETLAEPIATRTVSLTILGVTEPGTGLLSRDYTAISDVLVTCIRD